MTDETKQDESKLIAERRSKLSALREAGNAYPNDFRRNATADELQQTFEEYEESLQRQDDLLESMEPIIDPDDTDEAASPVIPSDETPIIIPYRLKGP